jgi:hypothetical protein
VDYYNQGNTPGSVFEVAALANGVKYTGKCCGGTTSAAFIGKTVHIGLELLVSLGSSLIVSFFL